jgi:hypothetical protein
MQDLEPMVRLKVLDDFVSDGIQVKRGEVLTFPAREVAEGQPVFRIECMRTGRCVYGRYCEAGEVVRVTREEARIACDGRNWKAIDNPFPPEPKGPEINMPTPRRRRSYATV